MNSPKQNIIITGMPGSGKTTLGRKLKDELGYELCDFDDNILEKITLETAEEIVRVLKLKNKGFTSEDLVNQKVKTLVERLGKNDFLELEGFMGRNLVFDRPTILSTSGSLPLRLDAMSHLRENGNVIYINTPIEIIKSRLHEMKSDRIVGIGEMTLDEILEYRHNFYNITKDFDFKVPVFEAREGKTKEERAAEKEVVFSKFMEFYKDNVSRILEVA
ncbi:MAG: shikimate kinase [Candidatus Gracilibacteria bacterium]|nr:shikimate kinase [Candidatus Gracilibacteria bacterium]